MRLDCFLKERMVLYIDVDYHIHIYTSHRFSSYYHHHTCWYTGTSSYLSWTSYHYCMWWKFLLGTVEERRKIKKEEKKRTRKEVSKIKMCFGICTALLIIGAVAATGGAVTAGVLLANANAGLQKLDGGWFGDRVRRLELFWNAAARLQDRDGPSRVQHSLW